MELSPLNKNTRETWEGYFEDGWEKNRGRRQTQLFAAYFLDTVRLPRSAQTLLDVGCAMGDALPIFREYYPDLELRGCDISSRAIEEARASFGNIATFHTWGFEDIRGSFDVIYCSGTLEHFENNLDIVRGLLRHCRWLYALVPYMEMRHGMRLKPEPGQWHVATIDASTFDPLLREGLVKRVRHWIHPCPVAWGPPSPGPGGVVRADGSEMIFFELAVEAHPEDEEPNMSNDTAPATGGRGGWLDAVRHVDPELAQWLGRIEQLEQEVGAWIGPGDRFILIDDELLRGKISVCSRAVPFPDHDGEYWGPPPDDAAAIEELERLRKFGVQHLVIAWPGFWWLDYYRGFHEYLRSRFPCRSEDEVAVVFDLRRDARSGAGEVPEEESAGAQ